MILTETLKCTVPSPNAVKDAVIHCVTSPTNATDVWVAVAGVATAVFTLLLAAFALAAWLTSRKQLAHSEKAQAEENARLQSQIDATQGLAEAEQMHQEAERQIEAFAHYQNLWNSVIARFKERRVTDDTATASGILDAGAAWRLRHHRNYEALNSHQRELEEYLVDKVRGFIVKTEQRFRASDPPQFINLVIGRYLDQLTNYQFHPRLRTEILRELDIDLKELRSGEYINTWNARTNPE